MGSGRDLARISLSILVADALTKASILAARGALQHPLVLAGAAAGLPKSDPGSSPLSCVPQRNGKRECTEKCKDGRERRILEQNSSDCGKQAADAREHQLIALIFIYRGPSHVAGHLAKDHRLRSLAIVSLNKASRRPSKLNLTRQEELDEFQAGTSALGQSPAVTGKGAAACRGRAWLWWTEGGAQWKL
jgi:hypothetical protein